MFSNGAGIKKTPTGGYAEAHGFTLLSEAILPAEKEIALTPMVVMAHLVFESQGPQPINSPQTS
jgi:hypothetical protein